MEEFIKMIPGEYILPMKKNGDFDKMSYWMKTLLPIPISFAD